MQITIDATGTAAQVNNAVATQVKQAGMLYPGSWPMMVNLRDYVGQLINAEVPESELDLTVTVSITLAASAPAPTVVPPQPDTPHESDA